MHMCVCVSLAAEDFFNSHTIIGMGELSLTEEAWSIISKAWIEGKQNEHTQKQMVMVSERKKEPLLTNSRFVPLLLFSAMVPIF